MKKLIFLIVVAGMILATVNVNAQQRYEYRIKAGFNFGGSSPLPLPAEIRSLNGWNPKLSLTVGANVLRHFNDKWAIMSGLALEIKGMTAKADVKNYKIEMTVSDGSDVGNISGYFTGKVKTIVNNTYATLPVVAVYSVNKRLELHAGLFAGLLMGGSFSGAAQDGYIRDKEPIGERVDVESATFDFSKEIRKFDWGGQLGAQWQAYRQFSVFGDLSWGANNIFKKDFESISFDMYNIYLNVGFAYTF